MKAFVDGVAAGAVGAIAGVAFVLGRRALVNIPTMLIGVATLGVLVEGKEIPEPTVARQRPASDLPADRECHSFPVNRPDARGIAAAR